MVTGKEEKILGRQQEQKFCAAKCEPSCSKHRCISSLNPSPSRNVPHWLPRLRRGRRPVGCLLGAWWWRCRHDPVDGAAFCCTRSWYVGFGMKYREMRALEKFLSRLVQRIAERPAAPSEVVTFVFMHRGNMPQRLICQAFPSFSTYARSQLGRGCCVLWWHCDRV